VNERTFVDPLSHSLPENSQDIGFSLNDVMVGFPLIYAGGPGGDGLRRRGRNPALLMVKMEITSDMPGGHVGLCCCDRPAGYRWGPGLPHQIFTS